MKNEMNPWAPGSRCQFLYFAEWLKTGGEIGDFAYLKSRVYEKDLHLYEAAALPPLRPTKHPAKVPPMLPL
jgi:hypothetical protein